MPWSDWSYYDTKGYGKNIAKMDVPGYGTIVVDPNSPPGTITITTNNNCTTPTNQWVYRYPTGTSAVNIATYANGISTDVSWPVYTVYPSYVTNPSYVTYNIGSNIIYNANGIYWNNYEEQTEKYKVAESRAEELLFAHISEQQKKQYLELGYFETEVNDKLYRIKKGRSGNVKLVEKGKEVLSYCIHPVDHTPNADAMLAQLLMLKTDEERFIKTANRTVLL